MKPTVRFGSELLRMVTLEQAARHDASAQRDRQPESPEETSK
jgi:hypothetical protein